MDSADKTASSNDDAAVWSGVGPKPWWLDDPEILAARRQVLEEFGGGPDESAANDGPEREVADDGAVSSIDDAAGSEGTWGGVGPKPWWFDNPEILAARRQVLEEFGGGPDEPEVSDTAVSSIDDADLSEGAWRGVGPKPWWLDDPGPDPILNDMLSGASVRELGQARDDLARAQARYEEAIRSARHCGLSWGEIGAALGVARQLLHRRFARRLGSRRGPIERQRPRD